jgi:phosphate/phosphite/phosphonate ABC transporter binding protein
LLAQVDVVPVCLASVSGAFAAIYEQVANLKIFNYFIILLAVAVVLAGGGNGPAHAELQTVNIGVLARRGPEECLKAWAPTAQYLEAHIPGTSFKIIPLKFEEVTHAVKSGTVHFILGNSSSYVGLQNIYGVNRMLTIKRATPNGYTTLFGGVIFCRADREDIRSLSDLKNKSFIAVDQTSFGGWIAALREFKIQGIDPEKNFSQMVFGGTHDSVVYAVRDGKVDAGTIATSILEEMIAEGRIAKNAFKIINNQESGNFPFLLSTRLYPEWPLAKLRHTPDDVAEKVAVALLSLPAQSSAALASQSAGWTVPLDYEPVDQCLKELKVGIRKNYGSISFAQLATEYRLQVIAVIATGLSLIFLLVFFRQLNARLRFSKEKLQEEVAERQRVNDELANSNQSLQHIKQQLENIIDFLPDATFIVDNDSRIVFWNKAIEKMSGIKKDAIIGHGDYIYSIPFYGEKRKTLLDLLENEDGELGDKYQNINRKGNGLYAESFAPALNGGKGAYVWATAVSLYDVHGCRVGAIESIRDITEQKEAEREKEKIRNHLVQSQKMEAIGILAGGIAHDFNNILGAILGYTEIAKGALAGESFAARNLDKVLDASQRAASLVKQILAFSRQVDIKRIPIKPTRIAQEAIELLRPSLPSTIEIRMQKGVVTQSVLADPTQLHQILMNLCTNAAHAMEQSGGVLEIILEDCELTAHDLQECPEVKPGSFVMLSVSDTGSGIAPDIWGRVFEPYFTTKGMGKGTGMGLSIVHGIVASYGGFVASENNMGKGTIFRVYFPAFENDVVPEARPAEVVPRGNERILFVDDEEMLVDLGKANLEILGYAVTAATSSLEAWGAFKNRPDQFDAVITDQTMPGMTGMELARQMLRIRPRLPIILCTGYSALVDEEQAKAEGVKGFAMKPLSVKMIATLLRKVLDESKEG